MVEQDFESSMKEAERTDQPRNIGRRAWGRGIRFAQAGLIPFHIRSTAVREVTTATIQDRTVGGSRFGIEAGHDRMVGTILVQLTEAPHAELAL